MLEKIFGKKSTGVVYIFCAAFLLFMLAGAVATYVAAGSGSIYSLVGYAIFTAFELAFMSLPVFVQKRYRLYIPPAVEIGICLYAVLFLAGSHYYDPNTSVQITFTPFVGGFVYAMSVFCVLNSLLSVQEHKNFGREKGAYGNLQGRDTDYRKLLRKAKANFFAGRILYLALYAAYLVHTCITFSREGNLGILIIVCLSVGFVLSALVYVYEYYLFCRSAPNQRLRKLKIAKAAVRVYSLLLIITAGFAADSGNNPLSSLTSMVMTAINLCVLFYNLFGKPRKYPSAKKSAETDEVETPLLPLEQAEPKEDSARANPPEREQENEQHP